jgi:hypothetical protein
MYIQNAIQIFLILFTWEGPSFHFQKQPARTIATVTLQVKYTEKHTFEMLPCANKPNKAFSACEDKQVSSAITTAVGETNLDGFDDVADLNIGQESVAFNNVSAQHQHHASHTHTHVFCRIKLQTRKSV